ANYVDEIEISGPVAGIDGSGDGFLESNYDITYVAGDLSVNKRAITVTALPQSRIYGELVTPDTSTFAVVDLNGGSVLPNSETINSMTITSNVADDSIANVGIYTDDLAPRDILTSSNGFDENNYKITRVSGDFTIDQRSILLTAIDQEKIYGNSEILDDAKFSVTDTFGGGGSALPNGETVNTVSFNSTSVPGDTKAAVGVYTDDLSIADQVGSNGFAASNYDISYAPGDYTVDRRSIELIIAGDNRFAGADYQIDPAAFATIDLDGDALLPNDESINTLNITSLSGVAEDPSSSMGLYTDELDADPASAIGSNGFSLANYNITITPGDFKIDPYPGLPSMAQDVYFEQWLRDNTGLDLEDPFSNSYAISQSLGLRLITLDSWLTLSGTKKQLVLSSLDAVPLRLQSFDLAEELIKGAKQSNKN
ncbi:MAG: MBG domain-containing protein, partial [Akkermansiaceae bacterium]|nr:MBG domain-containing protein [Akkermansiaceae bacterium]